MGNLYPGPDNPDQTDDQDNPDGQPQRRFGGGKYASLEEFERGYSESFKEAQRLLTEKSTAETRALILEQELQRERAARAATPESQYIQVGDEGLPRDEVARLASEAARAAVQEALQPLVRGASARADMLRRRPEYAANEVQVQTFLASNPDANNTYNVIANADPVAALEYAFSMWRNIAPALPGNGAPPQGGDVDSRGRAAAALPGSTPSQDRASEGQMNQKTYESLLKRAQETGDWRAFLDYRLNKVVPDQHFNAWR